MLVSVNYEFDMLCYRKNLIILGGLWYFDTFGHLWYPILGGAYLGLSAGFLWSVAGK